MKNTLLSIIIGIVIVAGIGGFVYSQKQESIAPTPAPVTTNTAETPTPAKTITVEDVTAHSSRESCWTTINGGVYDLTSWIPKHPGGEQGILQLCGADGSAKFNKQHGGGKQQAMVLGGFKIGVIAQ